MISMIKFNAPRVNFGLNGYRETQNYGYSEEQILEGNSADRIRKSLEAEKFPAALQGKKGRDLAAELRRRGDNISAGLIDDYQKG